MTRGSIIHPLEKKRLETKNKQGGDGQGASLVKGVGVREDWHFSIYINSRLHKVSAYF